MKQCYEAGIELTSLPGPAACITALTISGMATRRFAFEAFLRPRSKKEKQRILEELKQETRTMILYEPPTGWSGPGGAYGALGDRNITICRETDKKV